MEWYCSTGQSPQRTVAPTEEEEVYLHVSYDSECPAKKVNNINQLMDKQSHSELGTRLSNIFDMKFVLHQNFIIR
jgi:hypothetical protein